ncbi:MAG: DNA polymerase IV [Bacteroidia bacterium]|nr:DNA polymerase IV [Bacteroidia bacterium]
MRTIAHMDLDTFFVSVERLKDSRLNDRPIMVGGTGGRGVVSSCSYEARQFGVQSGMPMRLARRLCPHGVVMKGDFDAYTQYSQGITEIIKEESPIYEKASIDEFYIDMTGMERFFGGTKWAKNLRQRVIRETGLPISLGVSVNKMVSKVATGEAKPNGAREVKDQEVQNFLGPMPVRKIPLIGKQMSLDLAYMGVKKVKTLRGIPRELLECAFGKHGTMLYRRARGEDDAPVVQHSEQKSMSSERTFAEDTMDIHKLKALLTSMTEKLAFKLRQSDRLTACVTVKIRYTDFDTVSRQAKIPYCASDEVLIEKALSLFDTLYQRRVRLRLVGIKFSHLVPGKPQIRLFESIPRQVDLYQALDTLKDRYGSDCVVRASGM